MKRGFRSWILAVLLGWGGCSTVETPPHAPPPPLPPLLSLPHPEGADLSDLKNIFYAAGAPTPDTLKDCDAGFRKLATATRSRDELTQGIRELVQADPVAYHWCFYGKLYRLETDLQGDLYIDERQKRTLDAFDFLVPVARAFLAEFKDSRYLRFAVVRYRKLSEWVFFRKVELSAKETAELVEASNPFGLERAPGLDSSVLKKYDLAPAKPARTPAAAAEPAASPETLPSSDSGLAPLPAPGSADPTK